MHETSAFRWHTDSPTDAGDYITAAVLSALGQMGAKRVLDVGCGNGRLTRLIHESGFMVEGCDVSAEGVAIARARYPAIQFHNLGVYDEPPPGEFDTVVATEVIEHLYLPRALLQFARRAAPALILTAPYHGYLKNMALSVTGKWDDHFQPLADGGHIKFFSPRTLRAIVESEGFVIEEESGLGRFPYLWKSMLVKCRARVKASARQPDRSVSR